MSDATADPLTDLAAAKAFTQRHAYTPHRSYQKISLVQSWPGKNHGKPVCRARVHDSTGVGFHQCCAKAKTQTLDGAWWCHVHEPAAYAARAAKRDAKWKADQAKWKRTADADELRRAKLAAHDALVGALQSIANGHNDPRSLAAETLGNLGLTPPNPPRP